MALLPADRRGRKSREPLNMDTTNILAELLMNRQLPSGGWSCLGSRQASVETTSLAILALSSEERASPRKGTDQLLRLQNRDGGWPAFAGDGESNWVTALVLCTFNMTNDYVVAREKALHWLMTERGQEAHWFWRWKFKTADRNVRFNPDKYGWPWSSGTGSWVIPTAFSLVAIKQYTVCNRSESSEKRIRLGVDMLLDRVCNGGGWNSGNSMVYGVPLRAHIEATAIALLALQDEDRTPVLDTSLAWLKQKASNIESVESLAWSILALFVYKEPVERLKNALAGVIGHGGQIQNNATVATALLALKCGEMIHPFMVLR
jgi:hypothetical protein